MQKSKPFINLRGAMELIKKSALPLSPLYEAITNSLESIADKKYSDTESPEIIITLYFEGISDEINELVEIEVKDNGQGFTPEGYQRFYEILDKSKGFNNRGSGRLQLLHRFSNLEIDSIYLHDGEKHRRNFSVDSKVFIRSENDAIASESDKVETRITMKGFMPDDDEKQFYDKLSIDQLANDIKSHYMLRFFLDSQNHAIPKTSITVIFIKNMQEAARRTIGTDKAPIPQETGSFKVPYMKVKEMTTSNVEWIDSANKSETIKWAHFKVPEEELPRNYIVLCSKDIPVQYIKNKNIKKTESVAGYRYLTAFYGEVFDKSDNVSQSVDSFLFPEKSKVERLVHDIFYNPDSEYLFIDTIMEYIQSALPSIYKEIQDLHSERKNIINTIANAHGIPLETVKAANISLSDDEKTITKKLYEAQATQLAGRGYEVKKLYESLDELNPTLDDYQSEIEKKAIELSTLVDKQNKEELSRYIIRREMVATVLKKILNNELEYQKLPPEKGKKRDREGLIHDLIIKRKTNKEDGVLNDLWILNEEFLHFHGCSDLPLNKIQTKNGKDLLRIVSDEIIKKHELKLRKRPDIFLFEKEGKCVLIELKEPTTDLSDHLNQMTKYCNIIANYGVEKFERFYCYLIGESINPIDLPGDYEKTINDDWIKPSTPIKSVDENRRTIATFQIEIIKLSSIHTRAHRRNQSFADKLGLPNLLAAMQGIPETGQAATPASPSSKLLR